MTSDELKQCREAFERQGWYLPEVLRAIWDVDMYRNEKIQSDWLIWQAAWNARAKQVASTDWSRVERAEPVGAAVSPQTEDLVERVARAIGDTLPRHTTVQVARESCIKFAKAAIAAMQPAIDYDREQVRREALEEAAELIKAKRLAHAYMLGVDREDLGFRTSENAIRALIEKGNG